MTGSVVESARYASNIPVRSMGNHYHLMIETPEPNLTKGMRQLSGLFTQWTKIELDQHAQYKVQCIK